MTMALIDSVPTTNVTVPAHLRGASNGNLPSHWLRSLPGESTRTDFKMYLPVSYAMQAMHMAMRSAGINPRTTGRYRSYAQQEALFRSRYTTAYLPGRPYKYWKGVRWYQKPGTAMAATPGTSNHGLGIADDLAHEDDVAVTTVDTADGSASEYMSDKQLAWLRDNGRSFGFGLETRKERWHWHWIGGNALSQRVVDTLYRGGVKVQDISDYGFTVPKPSGSQPDPGAVVLPPDSTIPVPPATLRRGDTDKSTVMAGAPYGRVTWLQAILGAPRTGTYDDATVNLVTSFQRNRRITADGIYGPQTQEHLADHQART